MGRTALARRLDVWLRDVPAAYRPRGVGFGMSVGGPVPEPGPARPAERRRLLQLLKYEDLVAGVSGGVVSTLVLHPLDLVKVRFAVSDGLKMRPKYNGIVHCIKSIWKVDGIRGLYQGVTPNVFGAGLSWGLYFFFYNAIKAYKQDGFPTPLSATQHLISAAEAGAMTLCITNPVWVTKTRLVLQYDAAADPSKREYKGMFHALLKIYQNEGIRGLYKGFVPGLFGTSHGALQFMAYEELKKEYNSYKNLAASAKLNTLEYITMAALSKVFAVSATYPYQVIRARLQDQHTQYSGVANAICRTWRNEGMRGFYKGVLPNVVKVTPACCITFLVYENVLPFLLDLQKS